MGVLVVMGVCGSGKTTVAQALASKLQCSFRDADEFHSEENKQKMSCGLPLTDEDRIPWLLAIHKYMKSLLLNGDTGVVTCSALKKAYRHILVHGTETQIDQTSDRQGVILFVHLTGSAELIKERLKQRTGHFMPPTLLQSQLETLEGPSEDENHITLDIKNSVDDIVSAVIAHMSL